MSTTTEIEKKKVTRQTLKIVKKEMKERILTTYITIATLFI